MQKNDYFIQDGFTARLNDQFWFNSLHTGYTMQHGPVKVTVGPDVPKDLFMLLDEYSNMLLVVRTAELPQSSFFKLKFFLSDFCDEKLIRQCTNLCAIVDLLIESLKIYIFNIDTLTVSCKHFDNADVQVSVQQYKKLLDNFLSTTHVKDFKDALRTKVLDCSSVEEITLKLDESVNSNTLRELKKLVHHFFGNSSRALIHCKTGSGCVCITWLVPVSLVPTLRTMARRHSQDLDYFERQGVLELVIGLRIEGLYYCIIFTFILTCILRITLDRGLKYEPQSFNRCETTDTWTSIVAVATVCMFPLYQVK